MTNLRFAGALALALVSLAGCTGAKPQAVTLTGDPFVDFNPVVIRLATVTEADVQAALADAKAQKDAVGELCWQVVLDNLPAIRTAQQAKAVSLASAIQQNRDLQAAIPRIADACAAILPTGLAAFAAAGPL
jgi:hypothetical protein